MTNPRSDETMTEREADELAARLNLELGQQQIDDRFFVATEAAEGAWVVEERLQKKGPIARFFDAMPGLPW